MKPRKRKHWIAAGVILLLTAPVVFCLWLFVWPDLSVQMALRVYPQAQYVSEGFGYYGAGTDFKVVYYWTGDSVGDVRKHYETFADPFVLDEREGRLVSVFSVDGSELIAYDVVGPPRRTMDLKIPLCHYTQAYKCVNVSLFSIDQSLSNLPDLLRSGGAIPSRGGATLSLSKSLDKGTLIVYSYYVRDLR